MAASAKPASSRSTPRLASDATAPAATTGTPASARASPISCSRVVLPVPGDAADDRHPVAGTQHMPHRRLLSVIEPVRRHRPVGVAQRTKAAAPSRAKAISADSAASMSSFVVAIVPAGVLAADQGPLGEFALHTLDRDRADAAFQRLGQEFALGDDRLAREDCAQRVIDRLPLASHGPGIGHRRSMRRATACRSLSVSATVPVLSAARPSSAPCSSFRGSSAPSSALRFGSVMPRFAGYFLDLLGAPRETLDDRRRDAR